MEENVDNIWKTKTKQAATNIGILTVITVAVMLAGNAVTPGDFDFGVLRKAAQSIFASGRFPLPQMVDFLFAVSLTAVAYGLYEAIIGVVAELLSMTNRWPPLMTLAGTLAGSLALFLAGRILPHVVHLDGFAAGIPYAFGAVLIAWAGAAVLGRLEGPTVWPQFRVLEDQERHSCLERLLISLVLGSSLVSSWCGWLSPKLALGGAVGGLVAGAVTNFLTRNASGEWAFADSFGGAVAVSASLGLAAVAIGAPLSIFSPAAASVACQIAASTIASVAVWAVAYLGYEDPRDGEFVLWFFVFIGGALFGAIAGAVAQGVALLVG
jgi:hypothetical protein